ncbi:MAG: hypothetical protein WC150_10360 [Bacteroidia bacterium]
MKPKRLTFYVFTGNCRISINMATCSPGLYLVQLVNNGSILKTQKLLKQR